MEGAVKCYLPGITTYTLALQHLNFSCRVVFHRKNHQLDLVKLLEMAGNYVGIGNVEDVG